VLGQRRAHALVNFEGAHRRIVMDDQDAIVGPANVKFDAVNAEGDRCFKGRERVFTFRSMESAVRKDVCHPKSLPVAKCGTSNYIDVISFIHESALVFGLQIR